MSKARIRLPDAVQQALTDTGLPYQIEQGAKHLKIVVADHLVGILPLKGGDERGRGHLNIVAQIRRAARA
jgi:hypothetical protein